MVTGDGCVSVPGISCGACGSPKHLEFTAEMIIHFKGLANLDKPGVWVFPKVSICSDCGLGRFRRVADPCSQARQQSIRGRR